MRAILNRYLKVIDRYIIKKYLGTFVFTLGIFVIITVVFDISEHLDNFLKNHSTLEEIVFKYYAGFIPFYMNLLSPLINFLAAAPTGDLHSSRNGHKALRTTSTHLLRGAGRPEYVGIV